MRGRRGQSRPLCLGTEEGISRACAALAALSLCTGGRQTPREAPVSAEAVGTMELPALLPPVPGTVCPEPLLCVCPVLLPGGYMVYKR